MAAQEAAAAPPGESLFGLSEAARERRSEAAEMAAQATAALQASGAGAAAVSGATTTALPSSARTGTVDGRSSRAQGLEQRQRPSGS